MKYLKTYEQKGGITFKKWLSDNPKSSDIISIHLIFCDLIDLDGIEEFKNLITIDCSNNFLTKLPDLSNLKNLEYLDCSYNKLTILPDISNLKNLRNLFCKNNNLTELPDLSNLRELLFLNCSNNNNLPYINLNEYLEWHKKEYPWVWDAKKYNL